MRWAILATLAEVTGVRAAVAATVVEAELLCPRCCCSGGATSSQRLHTNVQCTEQLPAGHGHPPLGPASQPLHMCRQHMALASAKAT